VIKKAEAFAAHAGGRVARALVYEALQLDLVGEIAALLKAVGAPPLPPRWAEEAKKRREASLVKAGAESLASQILNFDEVERTFQPTECLHRMLTARGPVVFPLQTSAQRCSPALEVEGSAMTLFGRTRFVLNESECVRGGPPRKEK